MCSLRWSFLAICFLTAGLLSAQAGADKELKAVVDKAVKALGGADKLAKFKNCTTKSKITLYVGAEIPATEEGWVQLPGRFRNDFELDINGNKIKQSLVMTEAKGWLKLGAKAQVMPKDIYQAFRAYFHATKLATGPQELLGKGIKLSPVGEVKVGDRQAIGVQVMLKGFPDVNLFFDKETARPVKAEFTAIDYITRQEVQHEFLFSDYKEVEGARLARKMVWNKDGKKFAVREVTEITPADRFEDEIFAEPK